MDKKLKGTVLKYGDNINTDIISPPQYMELPIEEASKYAMNPVDPDFATRVKRGDIIVAGVNFGSGSSRELSPLSLKYLGVACIIAKSFARIFYRNSINLGLPVIECKSTSRINDGDVVEVDFVNGLVRNLTKKEDYSSDIIPDHILKILLDGGLVASLKKKYGSELP